MVFDARALRESRPMVHGWSARGPRRRVRASPRCAQWADLAVLAGRAGIDPDGLLATVAGYNDVVAAGRDADFGRTHLPAPIVEPPFYAIENHRSRSSRSPASTSTPSCGSAAPTAA